MCTKSNILPMRWFSYSSKLYCVIITSSNIYSPKFMRKEKLRSLKGVILTNKHVTHSSLLCLLLHAYSMEISQLQQESKKPNRRNNFIHLKCHNNTRSFLWKQVKKKRRKSKAFWWEGHSFSFPIITAMGMYLIEQWWG